MSPRKDRIKRTELGIEIGQRLIELRKVLDYSRQQMASAMGISLWTYRSNEKGNHTPKVRSLCRLSGKLGLSLDWLLTGRGEMYHTPPAGTAAADGKTATAEEDVFTREISEMKYLMENIPLVRHAVLGFYQGFKKDNAEFIRKELDKIENPASTG